METRKITRNVIIILLIIFVPLATIGTTLHFKQNKPVEENPSKEFKQDGKLNFYNAQELIGTYTCENEDYCDYAVSKFNYSYKLDEYKPTTATKIPLIDGRFAFLMDTTTENLQTAETLLYDISTSKVIGKYQEVKNYGIGIENNNYLVKNASGLWGVVEFYDGVNLKIPFAYDYIGLANRIDTSSGQILSNTFAVLKEGTWKLINSNNKELTEELEEEIFSYDNNYIVLVNQEGMHLIDYESRNLLNGTYKYINFYNKYLTIIDNNNKFYIYDPIGSKAMSNEYDVVGIEDVELNTEGSNITISKNGELLETIAIL